MFMHQSDICPILCQLMTILANSLDIDLKIVLSFIYFGAWKLNGHFHPILTFFFTVMDPTGGDHPVWRSQTVSDGVKNIGFFG